MKLASLALICLLGSLLLPGCQLPGMSSYGRSWGNPVVTIASVSEKNGSARDLTPLTPFDTPEYPPSLLGGGWEGYVDVLFHLQPDGIVTNASILGSSQKDFEEGVLSTVKKWQFPPPGPKVKTGAAGESDDIELVCRIQFSIQQSWRGPEGQDSGGSRGRKGRVTTSPSSSERSHEMKTP